MHDPNGAPGTSRAPRFVVGHLAAYLSAMRLFCLLLLSILVGPLAQAQIQLGAPVPDEVVTWSATIAPPHTAPRWTDAHAPGDRVFLTVKAQVLDGWRVYAMGSTGGLPLAFSLNAPPSWVSIEGVPGQSNTRETYDPVLEETYQYHAGEARFWQALRISDDAPTGSTEITGKVRFAACNDEVCLPPRDVPFRALLTVRERERR